MIIHSSSKGNLEQSVLARIIKLILIRRLDKTLSAALMMISLHTCVECALHVFNHCGVYNTTMKIHSMVPSCHFLLNEDRNE